MKPESKCEKHDLLLVKQMVPRHGDRGRCRQAQLCPGRVIVDVAVRHGCIMLSMDVCELQRIAQQRSEGQAGPSQHKITQVGLAKRGGAWEHQHHVEHECVCAALDCAVDACRPSWPLTSQDHPGRIPQ
eukprot:scaffold89971_cov17-Tisochrysis_lutea.AAC.2